MTLLRLEARIGVLTDLLLVLDSLDVDVSVSDQLSLTVELCVEFSVLSFAIVIDCPLLVNLGPQRLNEPNVSVDSGLVVLIHAALVFVKTSEVLLQVHQLVLKHLVVTLTLAEVCRLFHELCDETLLLSGLACTVRSTDAV